MDVSIIIVNYNTKDLLRQCLLSVFEHTKEIKFETIVIDNASCDGSQQMLKTEFCNNKDNTIIKVIENNENVGFGRANNIAAKQASGKYLFLLNSDTILLNNAVKILFDFMEVTLKCGIACGNLFDKNKVPTNSYLMSLSPVFRETDSLTCDMLSKICFGKNRIFNHTDKVKQIADAAGADMMIKTEIFREINGFDSDFFMYGEDRFLNYCVKKLNYVRYNVPAAKIIHLGGASCADKSLLMMRQGTNLYYKKTLNRFIRVVCRVIFFLTISTRITCFFLAGNKQKISFWKTLYRI